MSDRQTLIRDLRAHGRGDELDPLLNDKKIPFSQREAIETLQELCMKAATALEEAQGVPHAQDILDQVEREGRLVAITPPDDGRYRSGWQAAITAARLAFDAAILFGSK